MNENTVLITCFDCSKTDQVLINNIDEWECQVCAIETVSITRDDLKDIIRIWDEYLFDSVPLDALSFCDHIFNKYKSKIHADGFQV